MALSQIQCLDENNVNLRTHESKPEFLYCEDQRVALEALLRNGRDAFFKCLEARGLRGFLSDPELETLAGTVEPYDPDSVLFPENAEEDEHPLSLHYWPELSDMSIPQMDMGWPDFESYRGVTRTTVYSQPPLEGQAHIKEVVRKMIAQAHKVIAVVMDVFTDVDIFRDLLDAGFKRRVSVYILLERLSLPHFLSMCRRANMHAGHLKHLRVRCTDGAEFYSRSSTKVRGQMGHRFMFVDGDKALSGSYRFTWMSSRLDKNLVTVITGQAVEAFDRLYRVLYSTSSFVNLQQVATEPEPEPEPIPQPVAAPLPSAALARKLHNPKYALVNLGNPAHNNSAQEAPKTENSKGTEEINKKGRRKSIKEAPPLHPGLANLEKVCMVAYLPTWPDPDPPKDVIGYINVRDARKPTQVHLQRSEMFETSQAIRFSSPFSTPKEKLPEVATLRQLPGKPKEMNKLQPAQDITKAKESQVDRASVNAWPVEAKSKAETAKQNSPASGPKCESNKDKTNSLNIERTNTSNNQKVVQNTEPRRNVRTPLQSSAEISSFIPGRPTNTTTTVVNKSTEPDSLPGSITKTETQSSKVTSTQTLHTGSNKEQHTQKQNAQPHSASPTQAVHIQSQNSSAIPPNNRTPTANRHVISSSVSTFSESSDNASSSVPPLTSSSVPPLTSSSATPTLPILSSSEDSPLTPTSAPPIPKPRTIQLLIKDGVTSDGKKLLDGSIAKKPESSTGSLVVQNESAVVTELETSPEKQLEIVPDLQNMGSITGSQRDVEGAVKIKDDPQQKEGGTSRKNEKSDAGTTLVLKPENLTTEESRVEIVNAQEIVPNFPEPKSLTTVDGKLTRQIDKELIETKALEKTTTCPELAEAPNKNGENVTNCKANSEKAPELQKMSESESAPQDIGVLETVDLTSTTHTTHSTSQGETPKTLEGKHTPEKTFHLQLSDTHTADLRSLTPDGELPWLKALARTPTPDGIHSRTPTPDSRSNTPDFRTPTPEVSDGYVSAIDSAASEDYYDCVGSPCLVEPDFDRAANPNHSMAEDHASPTHTHSRNATNSNRKHNTKTLSSETKSLSRTAKVSSSSSSSSSSSLEKAVKKEGEESANNNSGSKDVEKKRGAEGTEGDSPGRERTGSKVKESKGTVEKNKEAPSQAPKKQKVSNQSAVERPVDGGGTPGTNDGVEPKRLSTGDSTPKTVCTEREAPDKEKKPLGPSVVARREKPQTTKETEGKKYSVQPTPVA
ncbi:protein FAM83G-like isoform X2 [Labrus mixtus]|uniref:protein FAM83G-like isoform X2 n=1 Tax=Labrus mixtus TaxID=508554 RepID=UPI0029C0E5DE|nr:protein FAM83G-like isoform X2 [Labrus mixtus]